MWPITQRDTGMLQPNGEVRKNTPRPAFAQKHPDQISPGFSFVKQLLQIHKNNDQCSPKNSEKRHTWWLFRTNTLASCNLKRLDGKSKVISWPCVMSWDLYLEAEIMQIQMRVNMWVVTVWIINHEHNLPVDIVASPSLLVLKLATDLFFEQYIL